MRLFAIDLWHKLAVAKTETSVSRYLQGAKSVEKKNDQPGPSFVVAHLGTTRHPHSFEYSLDSIDTRVDLMVLSC